MRGVDLGTVGKMQTQLYADVLKTAYTELFENSDLFVFSASVTSQLLAFASHASIAR